MPATVWKGFISFGLVSLPVRLFAAARYSRIEFHEIHRSCGYRLRQQLVCPHDHTVVPRSEVALAHPIDKNKMIAVQEKELRALEPPSSRTMEILQFAHLEEVDPIYFETSYFSVPEQAGRRAYKLLKETMERQGLAAIAKITLHRRERTGIIRPYQGGLILHTIYYPNEIQAIPEYGKTDSVNLKKEEIGLSEQFAKQLVKPFRPDEFRDEYQARVRELLRTKRTGRVWPVTAKRQTPAPVIDLMAALKKSLAAKRLRKSTNRSNLAPARKTA
jgi:DNA end-binding protein Ku